VVQFYILRQESVWPLRNKNPPPGIVRRFLSRPVIFVSLFDISPCDCATLRSESQDNMRNHVCSQAK